MIRILATISWARPKTLALALLLTVALAMAAAGIANAAPATFTVTNTNDSGPGSLRQAITDANANANPAEVDTINFDIPASDPDASSVFTISPTSALPDINQAVSIDGYSQPGASPNTLDTGSNAALKIELSGADLGAAVVPGIAITAPNSVVQGLIINRWSDVGILVLGSNATGNTIEGNYIGTDAAGTADLGNANQGVLIDEASNNVVGGTSTAARNLISGNGRSGVLVDGSSSGASGNRIQGNYIGTDASGTAGLGNSAYGVNISNAPNNVVGGTTAAARNIISGNGLGGTSVSGSGASGNTVQGNYIGTNASGTTDLGNADQGVFIDGAQNNVVGGTTAGARNIISGNDHRGVEVVGTNASSNTIEGNYIGTNASGTASLGNSERGVQIENASNNVVGGTTAEARNIISGNGGSGVAVDDTGPDTNASGNTVQGNYIGTDASGTTKLSNGAFGVLITGAQNNVVGGATAGARNIISGNGRVGVGVRGSGASADASGNTIQGNYIGISASGTVGLGNSEGGVHIEDAPNNLVGGTTTAARNIISKNGFGVEVLGSNASGNTVQGNYIGTDASGSAPLGNSNYGVHIEDAPNNLVGGTTAAARNIISKNDFGVEVFGSNATGNRILRNSIFDNGKLGIDLRGGTDNLGQVTANDAGDPDTGPNHFQNFPIITSATTFAGQTTIQGGLNSTPNDTFNLQFFSSPTADPSGYGEGQTYVGQTNVTTNGGGTVSFSLTTLSPLSGGQVVSAIATSITTDSTSEFSRAEAVEDNTPPPTQCSDGLDNDMDGKIDYGGTNGDPGCSSATDDSESPDPADTTSPTVLSTTTPTDGATGVARNANVVANFSEAMKVSTITSSTFKLYRCSSTKITSCTTQITSAPVSLSADGRSATLDPYGTSSTLLLAKNKYKAVVTTGAQDVAGNPLDQDPAAAGNQEKVWYFTTASR